VEPSLQPFRAAGCSTGTNSSPSPLGAYHTLRAAIADATKALNALIDLGWQIEQSNGDGSYFFFVLRCPFE
jgi:hypothetical protein